MSNADLPSGLLLEWQRKLKFKRQEMTLKMKKKKLGMSLRSSKNRFLLSSANVQL